MQKDRRRQNGKGRRWYRPPLRFFSGWSPKPSVGVGTDVVPRHPPNDIPFLTSTAPGSAGEGGWVLSPRTIPSPGDPFPARTRRLLLPPSDSIEVAPYVSARCPRVEPGPRTPSDGPSPVGRG